MQKKLIALAVAGLMSSAAFAQSSVVLSGRADAGYRFTRAANADSAAGGSNGGTTTESQVDGNHGTTEIWIRGKEQVNKWLEAGADLNLRYANGLHELSGTSNADRKTMYLKFPFATAQWGTQNISSNEYRLATKPYAGILGEWEGVKWSVSQLNETALTPRTTAVWSDPNLLKFGPVALVFKGSFSFGDNQTTGANNTDNAGQAGSGNTQVLGTEFSLFDKRVTGGFDITDREATTFASTNKNSMTFTHTYVSGEVIPKKLKLGAQYNVYKGYASGNAFGTKTVGLFANFVVTPSLELGASFANYHDLGGHGGSATARTSGKGWQAGVNYFLSKSTITYLGVEKRDFESNTSATGVSYSRGGFANVTKADSTALRVGVRKNF